MNRHLPKQANAVVKIHNRKRWWQRITLSLSCIVVFCTTYALIIPALTMEKKPSCGIEENHYHSDECYEVISAPGGFNCPVPVHEHTLHCYDDSGEIICGYADYTIHVHNANCYDESGAMVCGFARTAAEHIHDDACKETVSIYTCEKEEHDHTDSCYLEQQTLTCSIDETPGHIHGEECLDENGVIICGKEESEGHVHTDSCYETERILICEKEEILNHQHNADCIVTTERLICGYPEIIEHRHTTACFRFYDGFNREGFDPADHDTVDWAHCELICGKTQVLKHQHTAACFSAPTTERVLTCTIPEGHQHDPVLCYPNVKKYTIEPEYTCGMGEHLHSTEAGCYNEFGELICTQPEHVHDAILCFIDETEREALVSSKQTMTLMALSTEPGGGSSEYDLFDYLTSVSGTGTSQNPDGSYTTYLNLEFEMERSHLTASVMNGVPFTCDLPEGIRLTESLINGGPYIAYKRGTNDVVAFTYSFVDKGDGTYGIEITFDRDYVRSIPTAQTRVENDLSFRANIDEDHYDEHGGITVEFRTGVDLDIPPEEIDKNTDISVTKYGSLQPGDKLRYGVRVSTVKGTPDVITLSDSLTYEGAGSITPPVLVSVTTANGTDITNDSGVNFSSDPSNPNGFTMTLPQLDEGEFYYIIYEYGIEGLSGNVEVGANNTVSVESTDGTDTVGDTYSSRIWPTPRTVISKTGEASAGGILWTVVLNEAGTDIAGEIFTDPMLAQLTAGDIRIINETTGSAASAPEYSILYDGNQTIIGIQFNAVNGASNNNAYTVTYMTPSDDADAEFGSSSTVSNTGAFGGGTSTGTVGVIGGSVDKDVTAFTAPGSGTPGSVTWSVSVNIPPGGIEPGSRVEDDLSGDGHYMTPAQAQSLRAALQTQWGDDLIGLTFTDSGGQPVNVDTALEDTQITSYAFTIGEENGTENLFSGGRTIGWTYSTTADPENGGSGTFTNTIRVKDIQVSAERVFSPDVKKYNLKPGVNGGNPTWSEDTTRLSSKNPNETFVWMVKVKTAEDNAVYTVTDTLPESVELAGMYLWPSEPSGYNYTNDNYALTISGGNITGPPFGFTGYNITGTVAGETITLEIEPPASGKTGELYVVYVCRLSREGWPESGQTETFVLNNSVAVTRNNEEYGTADNTQIIDATNSSQVLTKSGIWNQSSQTVTYRLDINPNADDLLQGGDTLTLTDRLTYSKTISRDAVTVNGTTTAVLTSVLLEMEVNGEWITEPVSWSAAASAGSQYWDPTNTYLVTQEISTLTMEIPDETHLRLTYIYTVSSDFTDFDVSMHNEAGLEGTAAATEEENTDIEHEDFETHGSSTFEGKMFCLEKVTEDDHSLPVEGAIFRVYKYDFQAWPRDWVDTGKTYSTGEDGKIIIRQTDPLNETDTEGMYAFNTPYYIVEESAPEGYLMPDDPPKQYFWFGSEGADPRYTFGTWNSPDEFRNADPPNISVAIANVVVTNAQIPKEEYSLPETGGSGTLLYMLEGSSLVLTSIGHGIGLRRKRGRRGKD